MATINDYIKLPDHSPSFNRYRTDEIDKLDDLLLQGFRRDPASITFGIKFYTSGSVPTSASAGSILVEVAPTIIHPAFVTVGTITAATPTILTWTGNLQDIRVTPTALAGFARWRFVIIQNWI
jgi:hypothetical protein